ncbi:ferritin family protein [Methanolobus chelungpuianus]|uniref:Rubrerythrin n=1 Tax=Methanolobus chelungpuianus TaxID=502115 RepID=A0AAE3HAC0_9EURY|nr:ferritin family protein [Methanolobus chelungpuianus]MCQ6962454.1 rubrerythrin [Methanolobus chelungpuianus]
MLSKIPVDLSRVDKKDLDLEILRAAIIAEFDAISLYEQMAGLTDNEEVKRVLMDVAHEEKTHVGEFQTLLLRADEEQKQELKAGEKEVDEELSKKD